METGTPASTGELSPGLVVSADFKGSSCSFKCDNGCLLEVTSYGEKVVRFRFSPNGSFVDEVQYALCDGALDELGEMEFEELEKGFLLKTAALRMLISRHGLKVRIEDAEGKLISQDEKGFHWYDNHDFGGEIVLNSRVIQSQERYYGLGDIPGQKNLRGQRRMLWGSDVYGYDEKTDPLYKNIPFFIGLHHGAAYGIFFNNTFRSAFDFGKERPSVNSFWSQGGEMDYYFMAGPRIKEVVASYADLTGKPELPPLWALGFHQCKWSYKSEGEVMAIADGFREREIPLEAIYVDIDYMDGFRCFTWNQDQSVYPNPKRMTSALADRGIKTVAIIDPGIKVDPEYSVYQSGIENDVFCRRMDGPLFTGNVWPGACHFPDYTNAAARDWWADLFPPFMEESGLAGIWTDMNEPAVFNDEKTFPRDVRHDFDGSPCSHRKAHNVYGMQMARATQEGLKRAMPDKRPFVITRSAFSGTQRFSSAWTGDIQSTWKHLRIGSVQCQRLSLSGYSFVGTDIGGFSGESDGELFVRWIQLGVFHPFCRVHSSGDANDQEPWSFGDPYTAIAKKFIELRYRLLPYIYTVFEDHVKTGEPMLRSLIYLDQDDPECHNRMEEFSLGGSLLTCPVSKQGATGRWMYLPRGDWFDFWTGEKVVGGEELWLDVPLESSLIFVKAGSVLPLSPVRMNSSVPVSEMELRLYPDAKGGAAGSLYEDAGDGYAFEKGEGQVKKTFQLSRDGDEGVLKQIREGQYVAEYEKYRISFDGYESAPKSAQVDGGEKIVIREGQPLLVPQGFQEIRFEF